MFKRWSKSPFGREISPSLETESNPENMTEKFVEQIIKFLPYGYARVHCPIILMEKLFLFGQERSYFVEIVVEPIHNIRRLLFVFVGFFMHLGLLRHRFTRRNPVIRPFDRLRCVVVNLCSLHAIIRRQIR